MVITNSFLYVVPVWLMVRLSVRVASVCGIKPFRCAFFGGVVSLFHLRQADRRLTPPPPALCRVKAELSAALTRFRH